MQASRYKHTGQFGCDREKDGSKIYDNCNFDTLYILLNKRQICISVYKYIR